MNCYKGINKIHIQSLFFQNIWIYTKNLVLINDAYKSIEEI